MPKTHFTPEEYLAMEIPAEYKSQFVDGEIFAMAGSGFAHAKITLNLTVALATRLRGRPCEIYNSDIRVRAAAGNMYTYPDLSGLCGEPRLEGESGPPSLLNPQAIFEVLSPSTERFDCGEKFARYRRLDSLVEYVLLASRQMHVEVHRRQPNGVWTMQESDQPQHRMELGCEVPLAEIYEGVGFREQR